jgi:hypothetical protein
MQLKIILVALLLSGITVASVAPASVNVGPYKVSFNMQTNRDLSIWLPSTESYKSPGEISFVSYRLKINATGELHDLVVAINKHSSPIPDSLEYEAEDFASNARANGLHSVVLDYRSIDNHPGYVLRWIDPQDGHDCCLASFRLSEQEQVIINSNLPWQSETSSFVDTIHIENLFR